MDKIPKVIISYYKLNTGFFEYVFKMKDGTVLYVYAEEKAEEEIKDLTFLWWDSVTKKFILN
jgi:hypothetical protein